VKRMAMGGLGLRDVELGIERPADGSALIG
jgi:hypothetical protein